MIVTCPFDKKQFELDSNLVPENGRLLQCGFCGHKWHFKKQDINKNYTDIKTSSEQKLLIDKQDLKEEKIFEDNNNKLFNETIVNDYDEKNKSLTNNDVIYQEIEELDAKKFNIFFLFKVFLVIIITIIAVIITLDTFKNHIIKILPNIDVFLNSLYETLIDLKLFLKDLFI